MSFHTAGSQHTSGQPTSFVPLFILRKLKSLGILEKYKYGLPRDDALNVPLFSGKKEVNDIPYPVGKKNSYDSYEDATLWRWPGPANYRAMIQKRKKDYGVNMIGEGIIAPPPCSPQPWCRAIEGT